MTNFMANSIESSICDRSPGKSGRRRCRRMRAPLPAERRRTTKASVNDVPEQAAAGGFVGRVKAHPLRDSVASRVGA